MKRSNTHARLRSAAAMAVSPLALLLASQGHAQAAEQLPAPASTSPEVKASSPGAAAATETAPGDTSQVEDIVVTAQFREQNVQRTPIAITAINSAMLEARSQTNIAQVADQAPSVTLKAQGPSYGPALGANIRGVGQFDFNPALEPGVGLYVDDVYYPTLTGSILDLLDLDRVEILRGPQGTLAGKNSIGGAIKLYSKRPTGSNSGYVQAAYGIRNRLDLRGSVDFKLTDGVSARLSGVAKRQNGYVDRLDFGCVFPAGGPATFVNAQGQTLPVNPAGGIPALTSPRDHCRFAREGDVNFQAIRGQLRYEDDRVDINLTGDYTNDDRHTAGAVLRQAYYNGNLVSPNFVDRAPGSPAGATDINPYGGNIPYDTRFICGRYCNYASFYAGPDTSVGPTGAFAATGGVRPATSYPGRVRYQGWGVSGQIEYKLADKLQFVSISSYRGYDTTFQNDDDLSPLAHTNNTNDLKFWAFTQEMRLNGSFFNDALEYTVGGFYLKQQSLSPAVSDLRYVSNTPLLATDDVIKANTKAAFLHIAWKPITDLTLTGGLRYTDEFKSYKFSRRFPDGRPFPSSVSLSALDGRVGVYDGPSSTNVDYRLNASYQLTPAIAVYGQVSTGFKGGGVNPRPFNAAQVIGFGPEKLTAYELGFKSDLFDRHVRLNIATFLSKYKDIQLSLSNCTALVGPAFGTPCAALTNAGDADIKGVEVETSIRPIAGVIIDGAVSYIDFDYKRFGSFPTATGGTVFVGGPTNLNGPQFGDYPPYTPRWKWSIGAQYEVKLGSAGSLTPRVDVSYQSDIYSRANNRPSNILPGYTLANARLTWANADEDLEISAEVTNIFDKYYYLTGFDLTAAGAGFSTAQPGRPREWAFSVKKKF